MGKTLSCPRPQTSSTQVQIGFSNQCNEGAIFVSTVHLGEGVVHHMLANCIMSSLSL